MNMMKIEFDDKIFMFYYEQVDENACFCMFFDGSESEAKNYNYSLVFQLNDLSELTYSAQVISRYSILQDWYADRCIKIDSKTFRAHFEDPDHNFAVSFEIRNEKTGKKGDCGNDGTEVEMPCEE